MGAYKIKRLHPKSKGKSQTVATDGKGKTGDSERLLLSLATDCTNGHELKVRGSQELVRGSQR